MVKYLMLFIIFVGCSVLKTPKKHMFIISKVYINFDGSKCLAQGWSPNSNISNANFYVECGKKHYGDTVYILTNQIYPVK